MKRFAWFLLLSCTLCSQQPDIDTRKVRILFVGNSLTYTNNLPQLVKNVAAKNDLRIQVAMLAYSNYALEDHWNDGRLQNLIANDSFDYVVIQQGPSSQADGKVMLHEYGERIKVLCDTNTTKLAFFMVWQAKVNYHTFSGVISNYTLAASQANAVLCPVGEVWKQHFDSTQDFSYYGADGFHPSLAGSQRAAEIIFGSLQIPR
ncbi:MAG TPA: SGNH/GDSL hydrolase family protein [Cyclobacteriaceae bacterium]|nr:SGNH/GDSL hydrolase family protein [Cyclobacteriaceae bacterium]